MTRSRGSDYGDLTVLVASYGFVKCIITIGVDQIPVIAAPGGGGKHHDVPGCTP